jgi:hypothetical protein
VGQETINTVAALFCETEQQVQQEKSNMWKTSLKSLKPGPTEGLDLDTLKNSTQTMLKNTLHLQTYPQNTVDDSEERNSFFCVTKRQKVIKFLFIQNNTYNYKTFS